MFSIVDRTDATHLNLPTITYPNGGESIYTRALDIEWFRPPVASDSNLPVVYEIFFTSEWDEAEKGNWFQIATVPASTGRFHWSIPFAIRSSRCRIGIRARDGKGLSTPLTISADDFTITSRPLNTPAIANPVDGASYHNYVPIALDHAGIQGSHSQRSTYQIYYSSESNGIDWTIIRENLPVGSDPFLWDVRDIPPGTDYQIKTVLTDDEGNSSLPVYVKNLTVRALDYFILDTQPPKGKIIIEGGEEYTSERNVLLRLTAFDEATDVKSVTLKQTVGETTTTGGEQEMANIKSWFLKGEEDGNYCVQALFKDFAGNVPDATGTNEFFRRYLEDDNRSVTAFLLVAESGTVTVYTAFASPSPDLYANKQRVTSLEGEATFITKFNGTVYVAIKTSENTGILQRLEESTLEDAYEFTSLDSIITAAAEYGGNLYLGMQNGDLYRFNGTSMTFVQSFSSQIQTLASDQRVLYVFLENQDSIRVFDGTNFTTVEVANGNIQI